MPVLADQVLWVERHLLLFVLVKPLWIVLVPSVVILLSTIQLMIA